MDIVCMRGARTAFAKHFVELKALRARRRVNTWGDVCGEQLAHVVRRSKDGSGLAELDLCLAEPSDVGAAAQRFPHNDKNVGVES